MAEIRFFRTNNINDPGHLVEPEEVARQFWASRDAQAWLSTGGGRLERLALSWVSDNIGQWENVPGDWAPIFDAIHAAMPRETV